MSTTIRIPRKGSCHALLDRRIRSSENPAELIDSVPSLRAVGFDPQDHTGCSIAYEDLHLVLERLGLTVVELFRQSGYEIAVPESEARLYRLCEDFTDVELAQLTAHILSGDLCERWWVGADSPSDRIRLLAERRSVGSNRQTSVTCGPFTEEVRRVIRHKFNAVDLDALPAAAQYFDVSLRWLMLLDPSAVVFTDRLAFEDFYDAYQLLPEARRAVIDCVLEGRQQHA